MAKLFKKIFTLFMVFTFILTVMGCSDSIVTLENQIKKDGGEGYNCVFYHSSPFSSVAEKIEGEENLNKLKELISNVELEKHSSKENQRYSQETLLYFGTIIFALENDDMLSGASYYIDQEGYIYDFSEYNILGIEVSSRYWYKSTTPVDMNILKQLF